MRPFEWARVVCADDRLGASPRAVAMALALHAKSVGPGGQSEASNAALMRWTALSRYTVQRALATLNAYGYLTTVQVTKPTGGTGTPTHHLTTPAVVPVAAVDIPAMTREGGSNCETGGVSPLDPRGVSPLDPLKIKETDQVTAAASEPPPEPLIDDPGEEERRDWLEKFSYQVGETIRPNARTKCAAARAIELGHTPKSAADAVAAAGNLQLMKGGIIIEKLETIPKTPAQTLLDSEPWRSRLPEQCPHPESAERDLRPNQCASCRRDAMAVA